MKRIALVVQRCHRSIVGGSEALAWQYAKLLSPIFAVDVLTTTALDYATWENVLPAGCEEIEGIRVRRFEVTIERHPYWHQIHQRLLNDVQAARSTWTVAMQEEFIRHQGPYSRSLLNFLRDRSPEYDAVLFLTWLYPTTYFGVAQVPREKVFLAPTLHDEPPAYLPVYDRMVRHARSLIWLTQAERQFGHRLWGELPGNLVGMAIDAEPRSPAILDYPYLLYCGRIDAIKGCADLIEFFIRYKKQYPSDLRLILTGQKQMEIPQRSDIEFRGFVPIEEKFQLMAGAAVFVLPSPYESFSIGTLEAMAQGTPVLVNGACEVLVEHVDRSGVGEIYRDYQSFADGLKSLLIDREARSKLEKLSKKYILDNYTYQKVQAQLIQAVTSQ